MDYIFVYADLLGPSNRAGHTEFLDPFISDHMGVYWDVAAHELFDSYDKGAKQVTQRGLQLEKPAVVEAYIFQLNILYDRHRVLRRATKLEEEMVNATDRATLDILYSKFNALDMERIRYMKRAEKLCKQRITSTYEWSPTLAKTGGGG